jgi:hypothetical protein
MLIILYPLSISFATPFSCRILSFIGNGTKAQSGKTTYSKPSDLKV